MPFRAATIAPEFLVWRARRSEGLVRWGSDAASSRLQRRFSEHLSAMDTRRHAEDYRHAVEAFAKAKPALADWYGAMLDEFEDDLILEAGAPRLRCGSLTAWRRATSRIDPDALVALRLAKSMPDGASPERAVEDLDRWGYYVGPGDHGLDLVIGRGLADIHAHFEASDPLPLLWLRLAEGKVGVFDLQFYSNATLSELREDKAELQRRRNDRRILGEAQRSRVDLAALLGHALRSEPRTPDVDTLRRGLRQERVLLVAAWRAVLSDAASDRAARALDEYLFAKNLFLRRHQQRAGQGPGLTRFRDFLDRGETLGEKRTKRVRPMVRRDRFERMLSLATEPSSLRIVELRIAPQDTLRGWYDFFRAWGRVANGHADEWHRRRLTVRFVVHFIRKAGRDRGLFDVEFGGLREALDRQSAVLQLFRREQPELARQIVGVDVANLERVGPPEVFAPYLQLLRGRGKLAGDLRNPLLSRWLRLEERGLHWPPAALPPLGLTYHAGEDFYHPVDGMRAIGGLLDNVLQPGDRIGHGLAVGWDMGRFERERGPAPMPLGVMLDNLVWVRREAAPHGDWSGPCEVEAEKLIEEVARKIFEERPSRTALEGALDSRFALPWVGKAGQERPASPAEKLAGRVAVDANVAARRATFADAGDLKVFRMVSPVLEGVQRRLARRIRDAGVVVEANPSSNLVTGAVDRMSEHPFLGYMKALDGQVVVSVNTDDPGVFGTNLEIEYGLMLEGMIEGGVDRGRALEVLERSRRLALDHAFGDRPPHCPC